MNFLRKITVTGVVKHLNKGGYYAMPTIDSQIWKFYHQQPTTLATQPIIIIETEC